ncbi:MAG: molybdopterin molybdenumtransferase MoeA [Allomuricauda sp.]|nr:MAG: molybdopterin molybdenumtransferase MoeA [Allomuricauda sp.]
MISFEEAYKIVLDHAIEFGQEVVPLAESHGRILAEKIYADRDFPPFDRVTKDGIAIQCAAYAQGIRRFKIQGIAAAGSPQQELEDVHSCIEVMTGAVLPKQADTVVMYEHLELHEGFATLQKEVKKHQNIHDQGSDESKGNLVLAEGTRISSAHIGVLASVGQHHLKVKTTPKIAVISTGNELVDVDQIPSPHQIRKSNSHTLKAALKLENIDCKLLHFNDLKSDLELGLSEALEAFDVLLLSGGVSKGKYDFLPQTFEKLGVKRLFHRVGQRPGKPFWFGRHPDQQCILFAFPGNPASTFANYHVYFISWLHAALGLPSPNYQVVLQEAFENTTDLTRFIRASVNLTDGKIWANLVMGNGSGDLTSLTQANGFVRLEPLTTYEVGDRVPFYPTRRIL